MKDTGLLLLGLTIGAFTVAVGDRHERVLNPSRESSAPTINLCAVKLPITQGRLLKTQGEVLNWREAKDGGIDLNLVKEIDGGLSCGMKAHLPPTIPETVWRPVSGERVTLCGLMLVSERQPRMTAAGRCL